MSYRAWILLFAAISCLWSNLARAEIIEISRAFASVKGGVDQPLTSDLHTNSSFASASITEDTQRAKQSLGEVGKAELKAHAGGGEVGGSVSFNLKTSGFNPDSDFHVAGAGGLAQARWDDTIQLALRPYIGFPLETLQKNVGDLEDYLQYFVVHNHSTYSMTSTGSTALGSAEIVDFDLRFSLDVVGYNHEEKQLNGPEALGVADENGIRNYHGDMLVNTGMTLRDYELKVIDNSGFNPLSISLELWNLFSGRSGGDAGITAYLDSSNTSTILGIVFMNSHGQVAPTSSVFFTESASGHDYALLDQLPEGFGPLAVPEPSSLALLFMGGIGSITATYCRRQRASRMVKA